VTEGTWMPVQEWILAVNSRAREVNSGEAGALPGGMPILSMEILRSQILSGFQHLRNKYTLAHVGAPDTLWDRRLSALAAHFRRTFQISPRFMDLLRSIRAVRASIADQENGTRGKAEIFTDYFLKPSRRTLVKNRRENGINISLGHNIRGYASDLTGAESAPATVKIIDEQAGVFSVAWRTDPWGDAASIVPGTLDPLSVQGVAMSIPALLDSNKITLDSGWKLAVVLTVAVAVPNNSQRLYTVSVNTEDAYAKLNGPPTPALSLGPKWTIGIGSGVETARFMWLDGQSSNIENAIFQLPPVPSEDPDYVAPTASWESLKSTLLTNKATTDALAVAMAARVHSLLVDRWEGAHFVAFNPKLHPMGSMSMVSFAILGSGAAVTQMNLPPILRSIDVYSLLPDGARKILQRLVQE